MNKAIYTEILYHQVKIVDWENGSICIEFAHGSKFWYQTGQLHRTDGPAIEWANGSKYWWKNGQRHRTDGPAIEYTNGYKEWYIGGQKLTEEGFNQR